MLPIRSVDTAGKSRFAAKESKTSSTDEYYAKAETIATNRLIDVVATRRMHSQLRMDIHRAFLHLQQDELVLVDPPRIWKDAKATAGRDSAKLWRTKRVLYGGTKAPEERLELFGKVLEELVGLVRSKSAPDFFRTSNGQVVTELHMCDMHASGPCDALEKLEGDSSERASVKHTEESETL